MTINPSARPLVLFAVIAALAGQLLCGLHCAWPLIAIAVALLYVFRDPRRRVPAAPLGIVSPVDGCVQELATLRDPYLGRDAVKITLRMNWWGPYVLRSPAEGKVCNQWYLPRGVTAEDLPQGEPAAAAADPSASQPRFVIVVRTDEGDDIVVALRGPWIAQRLTCEVRAGQRIGQGQCCGLLRFGGRVDVYVPAASRIGIEAGARVAGGADIIATLVHKHADDVVNTNEVTEAL